MEFRFSAKEDYQIKAIESVVRLFDGQKKIEEGMHYVPETGFIGSPNRLDLNEQDILNNLREIQKANGLEADSELQYIEQEIDTAEGKKQVRFPNFSIEMETGTGKTYVYIRSALELNKRYGFRRFIIVVPSIAIKEGVLKTFEVTKKHFQDIYDNLPYRFYSYDSLNQAQVRQFVSSPNIEFMIMTLDSFNKSMTGEGRGNVIRRPTDRLQGATPIHLIQASNPILILDEPQNMESEKNIAALAALKPIAAFRYSATHRVRYNLLYRLTPAEAYRQGLVKKIEVASVLKENDPNKVFTRLERISVRGSSISASLAVNKLMKTGAVKETVITVKLGDDLRSKTNLPEYESFIIEEINPGNKTVIFQNGIELQVGESRGADKEAIFEAQIKYTIEEHFRKQNRLRSRGIKVLSLFFIDKVENYASKDGLIRRIFNKAFDELKSKYSDWGALSAEDVQASYFAHTKRKGGEIIYENSVTGESAKDAEAYDLIMRDKERLLSLDERVAFIFSHSALREGWDNPNVFQVCTLNQTVSEVKKRQEIGRGVRLAVDNEGNRIHDPQVNILTVIANQSYEQYVKQLQDEMIQEYGESVELPPKPANARKRTTISLNKEYLLKPEFRQLWEKIKCKTRYSVSIDTPKLIEETVKALDNLEVETPRVIVTKAQVNVNDEDVFEAIQLSAAKTYVDLVGRYPLPNLVDLISHLLENTTPPVRISRRTILEILSRIKNNKAALGNPFDFASIVVCILKDKLSDFLVNGIQYEKINEWYEMTQLEESIDSWEDYIVPAERCVYDKVEYDSDVEKRFVEEIKKIDQVLMYIKLPSWFTVQTPVGEYNPDWAIVWQDRDEHGAQKGKPKLYLVRETKSTTDRSKLRPDERRKITCGESHFRKALGVDYNVITSVRELP